MVRQHIPSQISFYSCACTNKFLEWNIFQHLWTNWLFIAIFVITCVFQVFLVEFGGEAVKTTGLSPLQWFICILLGLLEIPLGISSPTTQHNTPHHTTPHHTTPHHITPHHTTPHHTTSQHNTTQHTHTPLHNTTHHTTPQHSTTQHNTTQHHTTPQHNTT